MQTANIAISKSELLTPIDPTLEAGNNTDMKTVQIKPPGKFGLDRINCAAELNRHRIADCAWFLAQLVQRPELLEAIRKVDDEFAEDIRLAVRSTNDAYSNLVSAFIEAHKDEAGDTT